MARENQGLQVALILFVMTTVMLGVTTYLFYRSSQESNGAAIAAKARVESAEDERDKAVFKAQALKFMVGKSKLTRDDINRQVQSDTELVELFNDFDKHMNLYGAGLDPASLNYVSLPEHIIDTIQKRNQELTVSKQEGVQLQEKMTTMSTSEGQRATAAETDRDAAKSDLMSQSAAFGSKVAELQAKQAESFKNYQAVSAQITTTNQQATARVAAAQTEIRKMENVITSQKQIINDNQPKPAKTADGRIILSNAQGGYVLINLGEADNLQVRTTFNVYEAGEVDLETADIKGKIEVVRIMGDHKAQARVTDAGNSGDPILSDDVIFSEVFDPGQRLHVALAGFMDLNDDRRSDRDYVKNVLINNGAVIDAELRDDGVPEGRFTNQTTYLVLGDRPGADAKEAYRKEFGLMTTEAANRGIQEVTVVEVLRMIGWKPEARKVTLGDNASEAADSFQPRRPIGAGSGGAAPYSP